MIEASIFPGNYDSDLHIEARVNGKLVGMRLSGKFPVGYFGDVKNVRNHMHDLLGDFCKHYQIKDAIVRKIPGRIEM